MQTARGHALDLVQRLDFDLAEFLEIKTPRRVDLQHILRGRGGPARERLLDKVLHVLFEDPTLSPGPRDLSEICTE